jgi:GntR family transcriptional regulator
MKAVLLDKGLPVPLYHQLKEVLLARLRTGEWKPNDQLPTEDELGSQFGVSKATVRQALRELSEAGLVRREQGRGTFVAEQKVQFGPRQLTSFTEEMRGIGMTSASRVLEQATEGASGEIAEQLQVAEGSPVYRLCRLRLADGAPMGLQTVYIACDVAPGLFETDLTQSSLYETLERRYGLAPDHAAQKHFAVALTAAEAALLGVAEGSPALGGERLTYLRNGRPLEVTRSLMRGDRYQIRLKLVRRAGHLSLG